MAYAPLQQIIPAYLYSEYADDPDLQAFFDAVNALSQPYLDWFNDTSLAVYTLPTISGPLLDWIAQGIYGLARPVFSSETTTFIAGLNALPVNATALNGGTFFETGTATIATDDYYKRFLTWWLYAGNGGNSIGAGRYFNVTVLRLRVARWLYGVNGADVTLSQAQTVHIQPELVPSPPRPVLSSVPWGTYIEGESGSLVLGEPSDGEILGESPALAAHTYAVWESYVNSLGETRVGPPSTLAVAASYLLVVASPPPANGAIDYNIYAAILPATTGKYLAGLNALPVNGYALNGPNKRAPVIPALQNGTPIPIGTNWTEPNTGLAPGVAPPTRNTSNFPGNFIITVPAGVSSTYFQQAFEGGILNFPFQFTGTVVVA